MKVFHIRFSTESSDHWSTFVLAESLNDVKKALSRAEAKVRKGVGQDAYNCCYVDEIKEIKAESLSEFEKGMVDVYEQEIC